MEGEYLAYKQKLEEYFKKYRLYISIFLILFIFFTATVLIIQGASANDNVKEIKSTDIKKEEPKQEVQPKEDIIFDIEGAIIKPGVYRLSAGSVLIDAINKADGFSIDADRERIAKELNQASPIGNNSKIYIFKKSDKDFKVVSGGSLSTSSGTTQTSDTAKSGNKINLNKATLSELDTLPGIGPAIAQRIIDWRSANGGFEVIEDLKKVKGIGDSLFEGVKGQIVIE